MGTPPDDSDDVPLILELKKTLSPRDSSLPITPTTSTQDPTEAGIDSSTPEERIPGSMKSIFIVTD